MARASPPPGGVKTGLSDQVELLQTQALWLLIDMPVATTLGTQQCWLRAAVPSGQTPYNQPQVRQEPSKRSHRARVRVLCDLRQVP